jgi:hypothetical protein
VANASASLEGAAGPETRRGPGPGGGARFDPTPVFRAYARARLDQLAREDAPLAQRRTLSRLVEKARATRFGKHHDLAGVRGVADYQARVPLRTYAQHWDDYWRRGFPDLVDVTWPGRIPYFAVSSGTTSGKVKHIPCSVAMARANQKAALDTLVHHIGHTPGSRLLDGSFFMLGGSTDLKELAPGVLAGDISGIAAHRRPWWSRPFHFPPPELRFITDWEEKIARMAPLSLERRIRGLSGAPGWLLVLFERLASLRPHTQGRIADLYPDLELLIHGGVSFAPYKARFDALLEGSKAKLREVYAASEGYVAIADRGPGEGMRLVADTGLFYEFVPVGELGSPNPTRHWAGNVETGVDYAIALTTCAGLWSYLIGDVVRFVDTRPPRLLIVGRTSYMLSSFGEHLTGELVETCVLAAARAQGLDVAEFAVGTQFAQTRGEWGRHAYVVEFTGGVPDAAKLRAFRDALDRELASRNEDYEERRAVPTGLKEPVVEPMPPGGFSLWLKSRGRLGGQNKVPRVIGDQEVLRGLRAFAAERVGAR